MRKRNQGLTLIELVIVLAILAAVGGFVIPMLPNMLSKTRVASGASNIPELNKAIELYQSLYGAYPDKFDDITDAGSYFPYWGAQGTADIYQTSDLTAAEAALLVDAGIADVENLVVDPATFTADQSTTWNPYVDPATETSPAANMTVFELDPAAATRLFGVDPTDQRFVILGIGNKCTIVGRTVHEAPTHFNEAPGFHAQEMYSRYCAVFSINETNEIVRFMGCIAVTQDGPMTASGHVAEYWNDRESL